MATYTQQCSQVGSFSYATNFTLYVELTEVDIDNANNKSKIQYNVYCRSNGSGSLSGARHTLYFKINGIERRNETVSVTVSSPNANIPIASGTTEEIEHNPGGDQQVTFQASISAASFGVSASMSGMFTMTTIPRYLTINSISVTERTSSTLKVSWETSDARNATYYSIDGGNTWIGSNTYGESSASDQITSGWFIVGNLQPSTTYNIIVRMSRTSNNLVTTSNSFSGTTYAKTTPTISLSSKTVNSIVVTSSCNVTVSSTQYRIKTSSGSYGSYQDSATFSGLSPNTSYTIEVKKVGTDSGESGTATITVSTYQIATISTASNINHGDNEAVTYANPSGAAIAIAIYNTAGTTAYAAYRTCTGTSYTFSFTDTELDSLYKLYGTGTTITLRVYLRTTANNTNYYHTKDITITLKGNQKTGHININGAYKRSKGWININGTWYRRVRWINIDGTWKRTI